MKIINLIDFGNLDEDEIEMLARALTKEMGSDLAILSTSNCPLCGEGYSGLECTQAECTCLTQVQVDKFIDRHRVTYK